MSYALTNPAVTIDAKGVSFSPDYSLVANKKAFGRV